MLTAKEIWLCWSHRSWHSTSALFAQFLRFQTPFVEGVFGGLWRFVVSKQLVNNFLLWLDNQIKKIKSIVLCLFIVPTYQGLRDMEQPSGFQLKTIFVLVLLLHKSCTVLVFLCYTCYVEVSDPGFIWNY